MHEYDTRFYRFLASFAVRSAEHIVPLVQRLAPVESVADFGCGQGAWLSIWRKAGARVLGVDGPYVDQSGLMIDAGEFRTADLSQPIDLGGRFDLVQSLEVAEHLPADRAEDFVGTLTRHGALVMFSAAVPGQGGDHHINEQPLEYWREKFRSRGYVAIDCIRPQLIGDHDVQYWYRYNIVLYAETGYLAAASDWLRALRVRDDEELQDYWPLPDRIRNALVRRLPRPAVDYLSRLRAQLRRAR